MSNAPNVFDESGSPDGPDEIEVPKVPGVPDGDRDDLAALSMAGADARSSGSFTPERLELSLNGADSVTDLVVYVHEIHHMALNDSTAWGAALQIFSAVGPRQRECFAPFLELCRLTQEAFATFAAVNIVSVHHVDAETVFVAYPGYEPLHRAVAKLTAGAGGPQRAYLLTTALARVSMQTPILALMLAADDLVVAPNLAPLDTPDGRFAWLIRAGRTLADRAARAADARVIEGFGTAGLDADAPDIPGRASTTFDFDAQWELWLRAAYEVLANALNAAGATALPFNGHIEPCGEVVERARAMTPELPVRAARPHSPAQDDTALTGAAIQYVRLNLVKPPRRARLQLVSVHDRHTPPRYDGHEVDGGRRNDSVIHVRLPRRLLESYQWPAADAAILGAATAPVVAIRGIEPGSEESTIAHITLQEPELIDRLKQARSGRPLLLVVASASCFIDTEWWEAWRPAVNGTRLVLLMDVEVPRIANPWVRDKQAVRASLVRINDTGGVYWAAVLRVGDGPAIWLQVGDEMTVKLTLKQLQGLEGLQFDLAPEHIGGDQPLINDAVAHILATESFLDIQGLDPDTIRRVTAEQPD